MSIAVPVSLVLITLTLMSDFGSIIRGGGMGYYLRGRLIRDWGCALFEITNFQGNSNSFLQSCITSLLKQSKKCTVSPF